MARRYSGKYSPTETEETEALTALHKDERVRDAAGARANWLFVPPIVLAFTTVGAGASSMALGLAGAGVLALAALLLREGLRAEAAYNLRKVARRPALPRKMLATALTGLGVGMATMFHGSGILDAGLYGIIAAGLHIASFGIDPLRNKRVQGIDSYQQDRVAKVVDEAESYLADIKDMVDSLGERVLSGRVDNFLAEARQMIRTVEEDPRDLTGARKYLGVYLMGARDATTKFAELYRRTRNQTALAEYDALLGDLEQNFSARTQQMLLDDKTNMDIEIKVLRDRLQREGIVQGDPHV